MPHEALTEGPSYIPDRGGRIACLRIIEAATQVGAEFRIFELSRNAGACAAVQTLE